MGKRLARLRIVGVIHMNFSTLVFINAGDRLAADVEAGRSATWSTRLGPAAGSQG